MLFIMSFLFCVPLFGMDNTKKTAEKKSFQLEMPSRFWRPEKVFKVSASAGVVGFAVAGTIPAVASSVLCFQLINHKTRKGSVLSAQAQINKCDGKLLSIAQLAKEDQKQFMNTIKEQYGLPRGLVKVHDQLVADIKKLKIAAQLLEHSYTVNPENALTQQLAKLKDKKRVVDFQIQYAEYALKVLSSIPQQSKL